MSELHGRIARLIQELKRRGVFRVAAVYLVASWAAIQVSDVTFPRLGLPDWTVTFVIVLLAAFFPVVVGLSWLFDVTRTGPVRIDAPADATSSSSSSSSSPSSPPSPSAAASPRARARVPVLVAATVTLALIGGGLWYVSDARASGLDPQLVAVMPFRVAGASPDVAYLREGLMDLLAARVGGVEGELRVVAPRTMSRRLRESLGSMDADPGEEAALELAFELGAGRMLQGEVVGSGRGVIVTATLYDVAAGRVIDSKPFQPVPADSIHALVDAIATQMIAAESGLRSDRLAAITTRSVPALRAFIDAEHAFRRGQHRRAVLSYDRAVQLDTTFAIAALGLLRARGWSVAEQPETSYETATAIVQRGIDRLGAADRAFFEVFDHTRGQTRRDGLDQTMRAVEQYPEQADLQYLLGDRLLHMGEWIGVADALDRARVQLERVVAMDSTYAEPLIHLYELAVMREDTAGVRRYGELLLAIDSAGTYATNVRYVRGLGLDGSRGAAAVRLDSLPLEHLVQLAHTGWGAAATDDVRDEILRRWETATLPEDVGQLGRRLELMAMRGGQPSLLADIERRVGRHEFSDVDHILRAIYWFREPEAEQAWMGGMRAQIEQMGRSGDRQTRQVGKLMECLSGQFDVATGDSDGALASARVLEDTLELDEWARAEVATCRLYLDAGAAVSARRADALRRVTLLDDHMRQGPDIDDYIAMPYTLGLAWMWEELGEPERALAATRRRIYLPYSQYWLNEMNGERARLADQLGHREEAIDAYREYLSHFHAPEPPFDARAARARQRLAVLAGEGQ